MQTRDLQRDRDIAAMFKSGRTLQEIGNEFKVSRERVRQIISRQGIHREDGGLHVKLFSEERYRPTPTYRPELRCFTTYGCSIEAVAAIDGEAPRGSPSSPSGKFRTQKRSAKTRGIEWKITLPEWWRIWHESGKWTLRGRGKGYCMARVGDTGPYSTDNVEIKTIGENFSESYIKHPWRERFPQKSHCVHGHERTPENLTKGGRCLTCKRIADRVNKNG